MLLSLVFCCLSCGLVALTSASAVEMQQIPEPLTVTVKCNGQLGRVDVTVPSGRTALAPHCPSVQCPVVESPVLKCPVLQCPVVECPVQQCPAVKCPAVECPVQQCPAVKCPVHRCPPPAYEFFPGLGFYRFHAYGATWQQGQDRCVQEGAHLIVLNSEQEAQVVTTLFARHPNMPGAEQTGWAWTGVSERGENGKYVTIFGDPLQTTGYNIWSPTEPNDGGTNDCVLTNRLNAHLADAACSRVFAFICELEL